MAKNKILWQYNIEDTGSDVIAVELHFLFTIIIQHNTGNKFTYSVCAQRTGIRYDISRFLGAARQST
jgi:hypothetical protein